MKLLLGCISLGALGFAEESMALLPTVISQQELRGQYFSISDFIRQEKRSYSFKGRVKHGHVQEIASNWDWGSRTGVGIETVVDSWNVIATYSRFYTKTFASTAMPSGLFVPTWGKEEAGVDAWRLHLDLADMEVGKSFLARPALTLRPHIGFRGAWIYQKARPATPRVDFPKSRTPFFVNNCLGLGVRSGLDSLWRLTHGLSLFGEGALSFLTGYYNIDRKTRPVRQDDQFFDEKNRASGTITTAECSFGFQYAAPVKKSLITFSLGYEVNYVFNQTRWMDWFSNAKGALADAGSGMSLQGVTLGVRLDF